MWLVDCIIDSLLAFGDELCLLAKVFLSPCSNTLYRIVLVSNAVLPEGLKAVSL